ncbi:putative Embryonic protein UVS.2 [Hypsibius exemplaris]|uniref:Metalloendopeptidase n=1 Tax=Hypsibius exemplaris TaxID=2072580 RepID=A0A1W0WLL7_HYPEX|nr:putative Embryonic protein UVS.2 [Hypsibius exemplaris]
MMSNGLGNLWKNVILYCAILMKIKSAPVSDLNVQSGPPVLDTHLFQGDVLGMERDSSPELIGVGKNGIVGDAYRWPKENGVVSVPYTISTAFLPGPATLIRKAMKVFADETCIRFIPRTTQQNYLKITAPPSQCSSYIGRVGGAQDVRLSMACLQSAGIIEHELMHALGFYHEQARADRDKYVDINYANIAEDDKVQFDTFPSSVTFNQEYDFLSVMHYDKYAFAVDKNVWTIQPKKAYDNAIIGQRIGLSPTDIAKINLMYNCENTDSDNNDLATIEMSTTTQTSTMRSSTTTTATATRKSSTRRSSSSTLAFKAAQQIAGGCCTSDFHICAESLPEDCWEDEHPGGRNVLLSCKKGEDPIMIVECPADCRSVEGQNSFCAYQRRRQTGTTTTARATTSVTKILRSTGKKTPALVMDNYGQISGEMMTTDLIRALGLPNRVSDILVDNNYRNVDDIRLLTKKQLMTEPISLTERDSSLLAQRLNLNFQN